MKYLKKAVVICFWLVVWYAGAHIVNRSLVLVGPEAVALALIRLLPRTDFWKTIAASLGRIGGGFAGGSCTGALLGTIVFLIPWLYDWFEPLLSLMKAVPVASFVILALMFMGSKNLAILIVWILVTPIFYYSVLQGLRSADRDLLEVAQVFHISRPGRIYGIYRPALRPFALSAVKMAVGMAWKSGVAAEVIGVSAGSIGEQLYMSKIYLETADLYAWTLVIITLSGLCEYLLIKGVRCLLGSGGIHDE